MTDDLVVRLRLEARCHAYEARSANATINEIYQIVSGGRGEPGNWHGAEPVRRFVEAAEARVRELEATITRLQDELDVANANHRQMAKRLAGAYERCAKEAEKFGAPYALSTAAGAMMFRAVTDKIAAAIRQLAQVKHEAE